MLARWLTLLMIVLLAGCATPSSNKPASLDQARMSEWQGRISVQVNGERPSAMSASFSLRGDPKNGELDLFSPLGTTLGALQWSSQGVQLSDGNKLQVFASLAELTEKTTGAALPIDAIFGWLQGKNVQVVGWQADLSNLPEGSLSAYRTAPEPQVMLRIKLEQ